MTKTVMMIFMLLSGTMLGLHTWVLIRNGHNGCFDNYSMLMVYWYLLLFVSSSFSLLFCLDYCMPTSYQISTFGTIMVELSAIRNLIRYFQLLAKTPSCLPLGMKITDGIILGICNAIIVLLMIGLIVLYCSYIKRRREIEQTRVEYDEHIDRILDPTFDIDAFLQTHKDYLEEFPPSDRELGILFDICTKEFNEDQTNLPEDQQTVCSICLDAFKVQDRLFSHPECDHLFHIQCIIPWLQQSEGKMSCPNCKVHTRLALFRHIRDRGRAPSMLSAQGETA